jgi:hypothetical protein
VNGKLIESHNGCRLCTMKLLNSSTELDPENGYAKQSVEMLKNKK